MAQTKILNQLLAGENTKRPPVWFMRQAGRVLNAYNQMRKEYGFQELMGTPELAAEVTLHPIEYLDVDAAIVFSDILVIPEVLGMDLSFTDKGPRFSTPLSTIENPASSLIYTPEKMASTIETLQIVKQALPTDKSLIGFCGGPLTVFAYMVEGLGTNHEFPNAVSWLYTRQEEALEIMERITVSSCEYIKEQAKTGIDVFQLFETWAGLIPYDLYDELILPFTIRMLDTAKEAGISVIFFPRGIGSGLMELPEDLADAISIDWQTSLWTARDMLGNSATLQGNLDPRVVKNPGNIDAPGQPGEALITALEELHEFGKEDKNWIFNLGHGVLPGTKEQDLRGVVDWIKNTDWSPSESD